MLPGDDELLPFDEEITELSVLLAGRQVEELEQAAHEQGYTAAQMIRRLIRDFLLGTRGNRSGADPLRQWA